MKKNHVCERVEKMCSCVNRICELHDISEAIKLRGQRLRGLLSHPLNSWGFSGSYCHCVCYSGLPFCSVVQMLVQSARCHGYDSDLLTPLKHCRLSHTQSHACTQWSYTQIPLSAHTDWHANTQSEVLKSAQCKHTGYAHARLLVCDAVCFPSPLCKLPLFLHKQLNKKKRNTETHPPTHPHPH